MHHDITINGDTNKPEIILHYNSTKSGVDNQDHIATMYTSRRKVNRWPMVLFFDVIGVTAISALIVWLCINPKWKETEGKRRRPLFLRELGYSLVMPHMQMRSFVPNLQFQVRQAMNCLELSTVWFQQLRPQQILARNVDAVSLPSNWRQKGCQGEFGLLEVNMTFT